ncbi:MAG: tetratricopeptide repeat protein [Chitinophagaceae bacterium]|nr:tetratricopeptide repeat protein [Chitinophagaceae bacterium]
MEDYTPEGSREELKELLSKYQKMRSGKGTYFLEEESFEKLIDYFDDNDQLHKAIEAANHGIDQYPYSSLLLIKKADLMIADRQYSEALDVLEKVSVLDNTDTNLYILKIEAYLALGMGEKALALFEDALALFEGKERVEFLFDVADVFDDYEETEHVFLCLKLILDQEPNNQEALYKICFWTDYLEKFEESIELHKKIIDAHPYNHLAWFNLGTAFQGLKLYEKAIDAYQYSIAIDDKFDYAYRNLGDAYIRIRKYHEAIEALEKVLELSIPEDVIYEALGYCFEKTKNYSQARVHYRKAIHLKQGDSQLYYRVGLTFMKEENFVGAMPYLETALSIQPSNVDFKFAMAQCCEHTGILKQAFEYYNDFISSRPKSVKGWKALIHCLYSYGFYEEGINQAGLGYAITEKPVFKYYKASGLFRFGKVKEGLVWLELALVDAPHLFKEFASLDPESLQRTSVVRLVNSYLPKKKSKTKKK